MKETEFPRIEEGYGMRCKSFYPSLWKPEACALFYQASALKCPGIRAMYKRYLEEKKIPDSGTAMTGFVRKYEQGGHYGLGGLIVDTINELEYGGRSVFLIDDKTIFVAPYIPKDDEEARLLPTMEDIDRVISIYIGPLLVNPARVRWLSVQAMNDGGYNRALLNGSFYWEESQLIRKDARNYEEWEKKFEPILKDLC